MTENPRKIIIFIIAVIFFSLIVIFGLTRFNRYLSGPSITAISISDYMVVDTSLLTINGISKNTSTIIINGKQIPLTENLEFEKKIVLPSGHSIIEIDVIDNFQHRKQYQYNISNTDIQNIFPNTLKEAGEIDEGDTESIEVLSETIEESTNPN